MSTSARINEKITALKLKQKEQLKRCTQQEQNSEPYTPQDQSPAAAVMPSWPEAARGVPNIALRSALFGVIKKGARRYLERHEIHSQEGFAIIYSGVLLDQCDLSNWGAVIHFSMKQGGNECRVSTYQLLKALRLSDTGKNRRVLSQSLSRMKATAVEIKIGGLSYEGSLITDVFRSEKNREYVIRLNPKLRFLFEGEQFTLVDWDVRHNLHGKPLAQWLHGFYASHAKPFPLKVETLHRLCGSDSELRRFRQTLGKALAAVAEASKARGLTFSFELRGGLVCVETKPSGSQRRHLAKQRRPRA